MSQRRKAFTLIELLTVIAITAILLTVIVLPIIDSFRLLRAGQGWSEAQERARLLLDKISREVATSVGVRDNAGIGGQIAVIVPTGPGSADATITEYLNYAKLDIMKPAQGEPQVIGGQTVYVDPNTGKIDPTLRAPKGQPLLPAAAGSTLVRYFVGLRDPFSTNAATPNAAGTYNDPYDGLLAARNGQQDNLYVLYRAEVQPYVYQPGSNSFSANTDFFAVDANNNPILDDPNFFVPDGTAAKTKIIQNWQKAAVMQTEVSRYDMILPVYNKSTHAVTYDPVTGPGGLDYQPRLIPLLQFRPTRISNEPATPQRTVRLGEESNNSISAGADVIRTEFGQWSNPVVRTFPIPLSGSANPSTAPYLLGETTTRTDGSSGFSIFQMAQSNNLDDSVMGPELFDFSTYASVTNSATHYPFSAAVAAANVRSGFLGSLAARQVFAPYQADTFGGQLIASFGIDQVGVNQAAVQPNLPHVDAGTVATPDQSNGAGAVWAGPNYKVNDAYNLAWATYNGLGGHGNLHGNLERYIDLRVTPNGLTAAQDGTYGPLFPDGAINVGSPNVVIAGNSNSFARATIVPGSDQVWGPDQLAGPNYGNEIRYTRTTQTPGPNQYKINYVHQPEPADYHMLGLTDTDLAGFNPNVYDPLNFVSAVIQARYQPGYIQLNSDPTAALDTSSALFRVYYKFQFTSPADSYAVDYDSRQVMSILLTMHDYPQTNLPNPQTTTLKTTATVRNILR